MLFFPVALAFAEDAPQATTPGLSGIMSIAPLIILFVIFYFLLIRPQQKRAKEHKQMISAIQKGDQVVTTGGMHGRVASVNEDTVSVEVAEGVKVKVSKEAISVRKPQA
ncbi:MAG: preprotein translocase subunit YajC [Deltaproteobacteria bacterium GWA2_54_12]|nr:MAG: preprotein translocase subunit YajC [Deltaproteobacteria bacterium GWA2_54_12]